MGVLDVRAYYPSVNVALLGELLISLGGDEATVSELCDAVSEFTAAAGGHGLPIGPEVSGPLGNVYLVPLDVELQKMGIHFYRLTDDVWTFPNGANEWHAAVTRADVVLGGMDLERAPNKTDFIVDPIAALRYVHDPAISVAQGWLEFDRDIALDGLHELVELMAAEAWPSVARFRFAMRAAGSLTDTFPVQFLENRPELLEVDPAASGRFLRAVTRKSRRYLEPFMPLLERQRSPRTEAVDLHLLRSASVRGWGKPEQDLFEKIASDVHRPTLLRAWALCACQRGNPKLASAAVDLATDPAAPFTVRRAGALGVRELSRDRRLKACDHIRKRCVDLVPTARYAAAFA